jgi:hypothetical protein
MIQISLYRRVFQKNKCLPMNSSDFFFLGRQRFTLRSKRKVEVQWTRTRFALVAQARNIGRIPHLWGDPLTPDGVKYPRCRLRREKLVSRSTTGQERLSKICFFDSLVGPQHREENCNSLSVSRMSNEISKQLESVYSLGS